MSLSDAVHIALKKARKNHLDLCGFWGNTPQAMSNKFRLERWSGEDLLRVAEFTGCRLAFIFPDGQEILIDSKAEEKEKAEQ